MAIREYKVLDGDNETGEIVDVIVSEYPPPDMMDLPDGRVGKLSRFSIPARMNHQWATSAGTPKPK